MNKTVKDLTDLELGTMAVQGQQQLLNLQSQLEAVMKELAERNENANKKDKKK